MCYSLNIEINLLITDWYINKIFGKVLIRMLFSGHVSYPGQCRKVQRQEILPIFLYKILSENVGNCFCDFWKVSRSKQVPSE